MNPASTNTPGDVTRWPRVCSACGQSYTAEQYEQLVTVSTEQLWYCWLHVRRCACGEVLTARTRGPSAIDYPERSGEQGEIMGTKINNETGEVLDDTEEGPRDFARFLALIEDGTCNAELSRQLQELAVQLLTQAKQTNQVAKGEIALKITIRMDPKEHAAVDYDIKVKEPAPPHGGSVFFVTKGGNLTPENQRQQALFPRDVTDGRQVRDANVKPKVREVGAAE